MHFVFAVISRHNDNVAEIMAPYSETNEEYFEFVPLHTDEDIDEMRKNIRGGFAKYMTNEEFAKWYGGYVKQGDVYGRIANPCPVYDYYTIIRSVPAEAILNPFGFIDLDGVVHMQDDRGRTPEQHKKEWLARLAEASEVPGICVTFLDCHI